MYQGPSQRDDSLERPTERSAQRTKIHKDNIPQRWQSIVNLHSVEVIFHKMGQHYMQRFILRLGEIKTQDCRNNSAEKWFGPRGKTTQILHRKEEPSRRTSPTLSVSGDFSLRELLYTRWEHIVKERTCIYPRSRPSWARNPYKPEPWPYS